MKINSELVQYSRLSTDAGIPVLAGVPLVSSLSLLRLSSQCSWFELSAYDGSGVESYVEVMLDGKAVPEQHPRDPFSKPLVNKRIRELANHSSVMPWATAVETLRGIRSKQPEFNRFAFFGGYKPFHLVLPVS
jgi:hypothetical protein